MRKKKKRDPMKYHHFRSLYRHYDDVNERKLSQNNNIIDISNPSNDEKLNSCKILSNLIIKFY